jgi:N-acetylated-alpha-linked acidic dipeptidase
VQFISDYPGDPTTPGYPSYEDSERQPATSVPSIPSLPISWNNAQRLLQELSDWNNETMLLDGKPSKNQVRLANHGNLQFFVSG